MAGWVREVHVEATGGRIVWCEGQTKQPALAAGRDAARQVEKRRGLPDPVTNDPDHAVLLRDEPHRRVAWMRRERERRLQPGDDDARLCSGLRHGQHRDEREHHHRAHRCASLRVFREHGWQQSQQTACRARTCELAAGNEFSLFAGSLLQTPTTFWRDLRGL
jgi:hypothetical protein